MSSRAAGSPQRGGGVGRVARARRDGARSRARTGRAARRMKAGSSVGGGEVGHQRRRAGRPRPRDHARASAGSRVPSRPIPVSSLTCTPTRAGSAATNSSRHATTSASRLERDVELGGRQRAHDQQRPLDPRRAQLGRLARRRHRQPRRAAALRRARGGHRAVAVAVGLDHRAQRRQRRDGGQPRAVALDRARSTRACARTVTPRVVGGQRVEHVDPRDDADQPAVLDHRQPVVLLARDQPRRLGDRRVGLDRDRVRGHHVLAVAAIALRRRSSNFFVDSRKTMPPNSSM